MSLNDPISNLLTSVRNGARRQKETIEVPASKLVEKILSIFKEDGYIEDFRLMKTDAQGSYKIYLKYQQKKSTISGLKRISKPGLRVYAPTNRIPRVLNGLGTAVVSTSKGVLSDRDARKMQVGGEVVCYIW